MKKLFLTISISFCILVSFSQQKVKKGFGFGALPAVSYDSDLGFQYGALVNLYDYGNGSKYPKYDHSLYLELSTYTKGTTIARVRYDSESLIPKVRTTLDVAYVPDQMADFYGFNGRFEEDTVELLRDNIGPVLADNIIGNIRLSENLKIIMVIFL